MIDYTVFGRNYGCKLILNYGAHQVNSNKVNDISDRGIVGSIQRYCTVVEEANERNREKNY